MSQKEVDRALILSRVQNKQITLIKAAGFMSLSYPQAKRLWASYKKTGPRGLISKKRGRKSNRAVKDEVRKEIAQVISVNYINCPPLFVSEKLKLHHKIKYSPEFIRQLMIEYKLWYPKASKINMHQRRQRRECEGELIQIDASDHNWFEDRGPRCHLHLLVDDATSKIVGGYFAKEETTEGYYRAFLPFLENNGRPVSIYSDKRGTFKVNTKKGGETQFARAMKELDIKMITAHSPQAKGRIERAFGTLQKRLVCEMRINHIQTIEEANKYLPQFIKEYNNKFGKKPANPINAYRPLNQNQKLKYILCTKEKKAVSKNLEVQHKNNIYQFTAPQMKRMKVTLITTMDNEIAFEYQGIYLEFKCFEEQYHEKIKHTSEELLTNWKEDGRGKKTKPTKAHPWKRWKLAA